MQLYLEDAVPVLNMEEALARKDTNTLRQPRVLSPIMAGHMLGVLTVGSETSTGYLKLDGNAQQFIINDGTTDIGLFGILP